MRALSLKAGITMLKLGYWVTPTTAVWGRSRLFDGVPPEETPAMIQHFVQPFRPA
jgi:hypothetical protein